VILQPKQNNFPDDVSLYVSSGGWSKGCWATINVSRGGEWLPAYSPKWGMKVRPEYVAWRIARRLIGSDKPFPEVRKMRDLVLSSGLASKAIDELNAYLKRVDDVAKAIVNEVGTVSISTEVKIPPGINLTVTSMATAFSLVTIIVKVASCHGFWSFDLKAKTRPSTTALHGAFLKDYWPEASCPPPVKEALRQVEAHLTDRIVEAVNCTLEAAQKSGSPTMLELARQVHQNRIESSRASFRLAVAAARRFGLSDAEISTIQEELIVEETHES
jgi:hypothetical protein